MQGGMTLFLSCFFFKWYGDPRDLHVLTHAFPPRRSSDLGMCPHAGGHADPADDSGDVGIVFEDEHLALCRHADLRGTAVDSRRPSSGSGSLPAVRASDRKSTRLNSSH